MNLRFMISTRPHPCTKRNMAGEHQPNGDCTTTGHSPAVAMPSAAPAGESNAGSNTHTTPGDPGKGTRMSAVVTVEPNQQLQHAEPQTESAAMLAMISRAASDPSVDIEKLERLMAMKERADMRVAETAFNDAMTRAQARMHAVAPDKTNNQTRSDYASYPALDRMARPIYTADGFALSFGTTDSPKPDHVRVTCHVSHAAGFARDYTVDMPADGKGAKGNDVMTKTHAVGSAVSYGQRYLLKLIFNLAVGYGFEDDDDDGNSASPPVDTQSAPADKAPASFDPAWNDRIKEVQTVEELTALKAEMLNGWGDAMKIPKALKAACHARMTALAGAKA